MMSAKNTIGFLLIALYSFIFSVEGYCAEAKENQKPIQSARATPNARYDWKNSASENSALGKNGKKKPTLSKTSPKQGRIKAYRSIGNTRKGSFVKSKSKKLQRVQAEVQLPSPNGPSTHEFVTEVTSPVDPRLERAYVQKPGSTEFIIPRLPNFSTSYRGKMAGLTEKKEFIQYSIDPVLQEYAREVISRIPATHVAIVAMEPSTGRILAIAGKSPTLPSAAIHAGYPAASLFKIVTTAAAIEHAAMDPMTEVAFRGGTYELSPLNYDPRPDTDRRIMSVSEALGRSCNPVFSRVALQFLNPALLRYETSAFGFNSDLHMQVPIQQSFAVIPNDNYDFGRTAAGFGEVYLSPVHAVSIMAALANQGRFPQPSIIDQVISPSGEVLYHSTPIWLRQSVKAETAKTMLRMMTATTTIGTSKREFDGQVPWEVPAKTGTLKGENPKGLNNWFIGTAPLERPRIAVAVVVVNPQGRTSKASHIGKLLLEKYLG